MVDGVQPMIHSCHAVETPRPMPPGDTLIHVPLGEGRRQEFFCRAKAIALSSESAAERCKGKKKQLLPIANTHTIIEIFNFSANMNA